MPPAPVLKGRRLPVEDYMPSPWQIYQEGRARGVVINACLKRYGMTYSQEQTPFAGPRTLLERRYGEPNVAMARRYGYWMPGSDEQSSAEKTPGEAETRVLTGSVTSYRGKAVPHGGCAGEALQRLDGRPDVTPRPTPRRSRPPTIWRCSPGRRRGRPLR